MVPDLAVVDGDDGAVLVRHRLIAVLQINDAEPRVTEADHVGEEVGRAVWPAMRQRSRRPPDPSTVGWGRVTRCDDADDATHSWPEV